MSDLNEAMVKFHESTFGKQDVWDIFSKIKIDKPMVQSASVGGKEPIEDHILDGDFEQKPFTLGEND